MQRSDGEGAAAPAGRRGGERRAQRVASRPVQQLQVAEETRRAEHLADFTSNRRDKSEFGTTCSDEMTDGVAATDPSCVCSWPALGCGRGWRRRRAGRPGRRPGWRRRSPRHLREAAGWAPRRSRSGGLRPAGTETPSGSARTSPPFWRTQSSVSVAGGCEKTTASSTGSASQGFSLTGTLSHYD